MNLTDKFIDKIYRLRDTEYPDALIHQGKRCLLDYIGAALAGAQMLGEKGHRLLNNLGDTPEDAAVIGLGRKADIQNAAFINGLSSHIAELDDGVRFGMIHPGAPVLSALLPVAEKEKVSGAALLSGIITGYEAGVRLACAIQPSHYNQGFHPTSTCGTIGAAMGIAAMLGFSKSQMKDALSAAVVSASGTLKVIENDSELKPFNVGRAAVNGLLATSMAGAGFKGPDDALSGDTGFLSIMADACDLAYLDCGKDEFIAVEKVYVKPYAACRHTHPAIEAAMRIKMSSNVCAGDIKCIKVTTYRGVIGKHGHTEIVGTSSAKMSIPYCAAVALVTGKAGIEEFTSEYINHPEIISLIEKVDVIPDETLSRLVPQKRAAIVEVVTDDGNCYEERVDYPKGEPENPLSDDELKEKFTSLAAYGNKTGEESRGIIETVWNIEQDLHHLFGLL